MRGARTLVRTMRNHGACTALVSGGFTAFTRHVQELCGFDVQEANELEIAEERLTGSLVGELRGASAKLQASPFARISTCRRHRPWQSATAPTTCRCWQAAGLGVTFRAHPRVRAAASARVDHGDLTALLFLQGYALAEFADD